MVVQFGQETNLIGFHVFVRLSNLFQLERTVEIGPHGSFSATVYPILEWHGCHRYVLLRTLVTFMTLPASSYEAGEGRRYTDEAMVRLFEGNSSGMSSKS